MQRGFEADVIVVGGGSAGVVAAVAAARDGARVILVERDGELGGQVAGANVHSICGLYLLRENATDPLIPANPGLPMEFVGHLVSADATFGPLRMGKLDVLLHDPRGFVEVAGRFCGNEPGIEVLNHSSPIRVEFSASSAAMRIESRGRPRDLTASVIVDASGEGVVNRLAGGRFLLEPSGRIQCPAYIFQMQGVGSDRLTDDLRLQMAAEIGAKVRDGQLPVGVLGTAFRSGTKPGEVWATIDLDPDGDLPWESSGQASRQHAGREMARGILECLRTGFSEFARAEIAILPRRIGVRESCRIAGRYEMSASDVLRGVDFEDGVAKSAWPIELRDRPTGPRFRFPENSRSCAIPLRCLHSTVQDNLFMAGRCISCTHEALASLRVIGTCLATGEAVGRAAAARAGGL